MQSKVVSVPLKQKTRWLTRDQLKKSKTTKERKNHSQSTEVSREVSGNQVRKSVCTQQVNKRKFPLPGLGAAYTSIMALFQYCS